MDGLVDEDDDDDDEPQEKNTKKKSGTAPKTRKGASSRVVITKSATVKPIANTRPTRQTTQAIKMEVD